MNKNLLILILHASFFILLFRPNGESWAGRMDWGLVITFFLFAAMLRETYMPVG